MSANRAGDARAANMTTVPRGGWIDNRDDYLKAIDATALRLLPRSRASCVTRFITPALKLTMASPRVAGENERDRLLIHQEKELLMQLTVEKRPEKNPRASSLQKLRGRIDRPREALAVSGMEGYAVITARARPSMAESGPVRLAVLYRGTQAFVIARQPLE